MNLNSKEPSQEYIILEERTSAVEGDQLKAALDEIRFTDQIQKNQTLPCNTLNSNNGEFLVGRFKNIYNIYYMITILCVLDDNINSQLNYCYTDSYS